MVILFEDILEGRTFVGLEFLDGLFELFGLVPLVDACEEVLLIHLAAHDYILIRQIVQLLAGAISTILQIQYQLLQVLLLQVASFQHLLPLLQDYLTVHVFPFHLLDLGPEGCLRRKEKKNI